MEIDIANERFMAHGLMILARNYLDVYPYEKWSDKVTFSIQVYVRCKIGDGSLQNAPGFNVSQ